MELVSARHAVHFDTVRIGEDTIECLQFSDMEAYIDQRLNLVSPDTAVGVDALPLWAKIWPAALLLAMYLRGTTPDPGEQVLEIGAGLGVAGLFAARRGYSVVLSDIVPEALLFARINALRNGLGDTVRVLSVDFTQEGHPDRYHRIIASEVIYREHFYEPLLHFFRSRLESSPKSEILISTNTERRSIKFFAAAKEHFQISRSVAPTPTASSASFDQAGKATQQNTYLYRLRPR